MIGGAGGVAGGLFWSDIDLVDCGSGVRMYERTYQPTDEETNISKFLRIPRDTFPLKAHPIDRQTQSN